MSRGIDPALEAASPQEVLAQIFDRFDDQRIAVSSAFGPEGCALVEMVLRARPQTPIYTIDTGFLFAQSVALREAYRARGANIVVVEPLWSISTQAQKLGERLFERDPDRCCDIRKVQPMQRILDQLDVWVTAIRRDQADTRADTPIVGTARRSDGTEVVKVAPLARWSRADTWNFLLGENLPYNELLDQGYTSIGCEPCTARNDGVGEERGGRWQGRAKTECGIHNL